MFRPTDLGNDERRLASLPPLTVHEKRWLDQARHNAELVAADNDRRRLVGPGRKVNTAAQRYATSAVNVCVALLNASATSPPQPPPRISRSGSETSDPTLAQITSTWDAIDRACVTYAHLLGPCVLDGCRDCDRTDNSIWTISEQLGLDVDLSHLPHLIDGLLGTPASSFAAMHDVVTHAATEHAHLAGVLGQGWHDARGWGLDNDVLVDVADRMDALAGAMRSLAGAVAQWTVDTLEHRCKTCGGGAKSANANCGRCRTQQYRERKEAS